jgi:lysophospholipase L1-like esterase
VILELVRLVRVISLAAVLAVAAGCSGGGSSKPPPPPASYYLALGDSLSIGVQPNARGASVATGQGYANQLYAKLLPAHPGLRLVKLGCLGETTVSMIHGGKCRYQDGSQLATAVAFLREHQGHVVLVTLDIGANDPEQCMSDGSLSSDFTCIQSVFTDSSTNLNTILSRLHSATGAGTRVIGMNYYLPALARWRSGYIGEEEARLLAQLTASYNQTLESVYSQFSIPVANVFSAFASSDFGSSRMVPGYGVLPHNVALICEWTWECASPPRGPNQHANKAGYAVIASAFLQAGA